MVALIGEGTPSGKGITRISKHTYDNGEIRNSHRRLTYWYTDASQKENKTGIAIVKTNSEGSELDYYQAALGSNCTVLDEKLTAIRAAIEKSLKQDTGQVIIRTDSKWSTTDVERDLSNREISSEIKRLINKAAGRIRIEYIEAHSGSAGNERADSLAKQAREPDVIDAARDLKLGNIQSQEEVNKQIKRWIQNKWINEAPGGDFWIPDEGYWEQIKQKTKEQAKRIVEFLTGHGNFRDIMKKKGQTTLTECRVCKSGNESAQHLLHECTGTAKERMSTPIQKRTDQVKRAEELLKRPDINELMKKVDSEGIARVKDLEEN